MNYFDVFILGIVEGITEFLPISSTAHLIVVSDLLKLSETEFLKSFEIIIQSGAILAVFALYGRRLFEANIFKKLIVAFIPTGVIGFILYSLIKSYLIGNTSLVLWVLAIGGLLLIIFEKTFGTHEARIVDFTALDYRTCFLIGVAQALAVVPGVSRAGATIVGGRLLGVGREIIVEFSFLLAIPTMFAATALDVIKSPNIFAQGQTGLLVVGFVVAFITAILGIKFLLNYIRQHNFVVFGVYRILIAVIFAVLLYI